MRCKKCNSPMMPVPSGSVCPNGHGKIYPPMNQKVQKLNMAILLFGAPVMKCLAGGEWEVAGDPSLGRFKRDGAIRTSISSDLRKKIPKGYLVGIDDGTVCLFKPVEQDEHHQAPREQTEVSTDYYGEDL